MAKRRASKPVEAPPGGEALARLRLHDRTATDWAFSAEGFLILYDPSVVTDAVFDELYGLQTVLRAALGWMNGDGGGGPTLGDLFHQQAHDRSETAARVARATQLGWECSLVVLPLVVASNGANVRVRATPPTADEKKAMAAFQREKRRGPGPSRAWIITRGPRLGLTWDFWFIRISRAPDASQGVVIV
ncbi:MAG: hypothetical protein U0835_27085 [Isosphaeraceae bacterium]